MKKIIITFIAFCTLSATTFIHDDFIDLKALTKRNIEAYFSRLDNIKDNPETYSSSILGTILNSLFDGKDLISQGNKRVIDYTNDALTTPIRAQFAIPNFADAAKSGRIRDFSHHIVGDVYSLSEAGADNKRVMCAKYSVTYNGKTKENYFKVVNGKIINIDFNPDIITLQNQPAISEQSLSPIETRYNAAYYYSHGDYRTAYQKYLEIIQKGNDGDTYYRLAVMTYYGEGCNHLFAKNKERYKKVDEYLDKAIKYGDPSIRRNAENMLENIH